MRALPDPTFPAELWTLLDGRLWHATSLTHVERILAEGIWLPEKGNYRGGFCRKQGWISLFDFAVDDEYIRRQYYNWAGWLGSQARGRIAVWLEIARIPPTPDFIPAAVVFDRWDRPGNRSTNIFPRVEAGWRGAIQPAMIKGAVAMDVQDWSRFVRFDNILNLLPNLHAFAASLPEPEKTVGALIVETLRSRTRRGTSS